MRRSLGIAVFSGMIGVTACGVFFTPVFYNVITWLTERKGKPLEKTAESPPAAPAVSAAASGNH